MKGIEGGWQSRWLKVTSIVLVFLITVALTIGVVAKINADTSATSSMSEAKIYISRLIDATQETQSLSDAAKAVGGVPKPSYSEALLGTFISAQYRDTKVAFDTAVKKGEEHTKRIASYASLELFASQYQKEMNALEQLPAPEEAARTIAADTAYLKSYYESLKRINALVIDSSAPSDLSDGFTEIGRVHHSMEVNWEAMVTSQKLKSTTVYEASYKQFIVAKSQLDRTTSVLEGYQSTLNTKLEQATNDLVTYRNTLE